jgi:hypothetical protein
MSRPDLPPVKTLEVDDLDWDDAMADLANRAYWSRFWVIQEFLLGRDVQLYCSNTGMNWLDFQSMLCRKARCTQFSGNFGNPGNSENHIASSYRALPLVMGRHVDKHPEFLQSLHALLANHYRSQCKDPRDRVFSLMGLVTMEERAFLERFFPDYLMTEDHVRIIALAHVTQLPWYSTLETATPDSEELFLGRGVESMEHRRRLLYRAAQLDYIGLETPGEVKAVLASHDEIEQIRGVGEEENFGIGDGASGNSRSRLLGCFTCSMGLRLVFMVILLGWWYRGRLLT